MLIYFGFNDLVIFTNVHNGVTTHIYKLSTMLHIILTWLCKLFPSNPQCKSLRGSCIPHTHIFLHLKDALKLAQLLKTKMNTLLCNIKIVWISMLSLAKKVLEEYKSLIVRMNYDLHTISYVKSTFEFLCDTSRLSWASFASCLCWKLQSMSSSSLLKVMRLLFVILHESYKNVLCKFLYTFDCDSNKRYTGLHK